MEFVNDWGKLEAAVEVLKQTPDLLDYDYCECDEPCNGAHAYVPHAVQTAVNDMVRLVPRLIKSYEDLYEHSMNMLTAWEAYMHNQTPAGLYVPSADTSRKPLTAP